MAEPKFDTTGKLKSYSCEKVKNESKQDNLWISSLISVQDLIFFVSTEASIGKKKIVIIVATSDLLFVIFIKSNILLK